MELFAAQACGPADDSLSVQGGFGAVVYGAIFVCCYAPPDPNKTGHSLTDTAKAAAAGRQDRAR